MARGIVRRVPFVGVVARGALAVLAVTPALAAPLPRSVDASRASAKPPEEPDARLLARCDGPRTIVVYKAARRLELRCGGALAARFESSLGFAPAGTKEREGDGRTPEGEYALTDKFPSRFHRSLQVNYPNMADADRGLATGLISAAEHASIVRAHRECRTPPQNTRLGSYIQVHGGGGGRDVGDWTLGCVAVDDAEIERVFAFHLSGCEADGTPKTRLSLRP
ncbi:MAG: L,D-transpeptidase family protein [Deltaproteobacteria bacterium]|nr:L,D-transpeptidase family protein [Deltaproteobacteria bacterium]